MKRKTISILSLILALLMLFGDVSMSLSFAENGIPMNEFEYSDYVSLLNAAQESEPEESGQKMAAPMLLAATGDASGVQTNYVVKILYKIKLENADGSFTEQEVAPDFTALVANGSALTMKVDCPNVQGYGVPYVDESEKQVSIISENNINKVQFNIASVNSNVEVNVYYTPSDNQFVLTKYYQNAVTDEYTKSTVTTVSAGVKTNDLVSKHLTSMEEDGFQIQPVNADLRVAADGNTHVDVYYNRKYYTMAFNLDGGYGVQNVTERYGYPVTVGEPTKAGSSFAGWSDGTTTVSSIIGVPMPLNGVTYTALWTNSSDTYGVSVVIWLEKANHADNATGSAKYDYYNAFRVEGLQANWDYTCAEFLADPPEDVSTLPTLYNKVTADSASVRVTTDNKAVLNLYYDRKEFTLTFENGCYQDYSTKNSITAKWGTYIGDQFPIYCRPRLSPFVLQDGNWDITSHSGNGRPGTNYILYMPAENKDYEWVERLAGSTNRTHNYYREVITGTDGILYNGIYYLRDPLSNQEELPKVTKEYNAVNIEGFTYKESNPSVDGENGYRGNTTTINFYYTRNSYNLTFDSMEPSEPKRTVSVKFEAPLSTYQNYWTDPPYPSNLEPGMYEFAGWFRDEEWTTPVDWNGTMPAGDMVFYAGWKKKQFTIRMLETEDGRQVGTYTGEYDTVLTTDQLAKPARTGYIWNGWYYRDNGVEKEFFGNTVTSARLYNNMTVYSKWSSETTVSYTVKYMANGTEIAPATTGSGRAGNSVVVMPKTKTQLNDGYQTNWYPDSSSKSLTLSIEGSNEVIFNYTRTGVNPNYTVYYLDVSGNSIKDPVTRTAEDGYAMITVTYDPILDYTPTEVTQQLILTNDASQNVVTFRYNSTPSMAPFTVKHYFQKLNMGIEFNDDNYEQIGTTESTPVHTGVDCTGTAKSGAEIDGYEYCGGQMIVGTTKTNFTESSKTANLTEDGLTLNFYYKRKSYKYEFQFVDSSSNEVVGRVSGTGVYGSTVSQSWSDWNAENPAYERFTEYGTGTQQLETLTIVIQPKGTADEADPVNIRTFYVREKTVKFTYEVDDSCAPGCGTLTADVYVETVNMKSNASGSGVTVNKGFDFDQWYYLDAESNKLPVIGSKYEKWLVKEDGVYTGELRPTAASSDPYYDKSEYTFIAKFKSKKFSITYVKKDYEAGHSYTEEELTRLRWFKGEYASTTEISLLDLPDNVGYVKKGWEIIEWSDPENSSAGASTIGSSEWGSIGDLYEFGETLQATSTSFWGDVVLRETWDPKYWLRISMPTTATVTLPDGLDVDRVDPGALTITLTGTGIPTSQDTTINITVGNTTVSRGTNGYSYSYRNNTGTLTISANALPAITDGNAKLIRISYNAGSDIVKVYNGDTYVNAYPTLKQAVDAASAGYTIKITGDTLETSPIDINKNLTIISVNGAKATFVGSFAAGTSDADKYMIKVGNGYTLTLNNAILDGGEQTYHAIYSTGGTIKVNGGSVTGGAYYCIDTNGELHISESPTFELIELVSKSAVIVKDGELGSKLSVRLNGLSSDWTDKKIVTSGSANVSESDLAKLTLASTVTLEDVGLTFVYDESGSSPVLMLKTARVIVDLTNPITVYASEIESDRTASITLKTVLDAIDEKYWPMFEGQSLYVIQASGFALTSSSGFADSASWGYNTANTTFGMTASVSGSVDLSTGTGQLSNGLTAASALSVTALNGNAITITDAADSPYASVSLVLSTKDDDTGSLINATIRLLRKASSINVTVPLCLVMQTNLDGGNVLVTDYSIKNNSKTRVTLDKIVVSEPEGDTPPLKWAESEIPQLDEYRLIFKNGESQKVQNPLDPKPDLTANGGMYNPLEKIVVGPLDFVTSEDKYVHFSNLQYTVSIPSEDAETK